MFWISDARVRKSSSRGDGKGYVSTGAFGSLPTGARLVAENQALYGQAECMQGLCVWLLASVQTGCRQMHFGCPVRR